MLLGVGVWTVVQGCLSICCLVCLLIGLVCFDLTWLVVLRLEIWIVCLCLVVDYVVVFEGYYRCVGLIVDCMYSLGYRLFTINELLGLMF